MKRDKWNRNLQIIPVYVMLVFTVVLIQGDFEGCADICPCERIPQKVTIEPIMPYTNIDIFREKGVQIFSKKVWEPLNFMKK
jgi:hypothetical protein